MRGLCAVVAVAACAGCAPVQQNGTNGAAANTPATQQQDSLSGTVTVVGADPATFLSLRPAGGGNAIVLQGPGAQPLRAVSGADVWVTGQPSERGFVVERFVVRRVDGQPVHDGIVVRSGSGVAVRTESGLIELPDASAGLARLIGARVWVTPPVRGQAPSFGEIRVD